MNKNYIKTIITITLTFISLSNFAQSEPEYRNGKVYLDYPICEIPYDTNPSNFRIARPQFAKDQIRNRETPCSNIIVTYIGFSTSPRGQEAQAAFQFAVDIWERQLESSVPIRVTATFAELGDNVIGNARTDGFIQNVPGFPADVVFPSALGEKLLGRDSNGVGGTSNDIIINFSSEFDFYFGLDELPPNNQIDFVSIVLHELGHGLGFSGFGREQPQGSGIGAIRNNGFISIYDTFIEGIDLFGRPVSILDTGDFPDPSAALLNEFESGDLSTNSPLATAQNGDVQPAIFSPPNFNQGSTYSHLDETTFNRTINALMTPTIGTGEANHDPGPVTLSFFEDMGWAICASSTLSTDDFALEDIVISPNPFTETLTISLPSNLRNDNFNVSIIDLNGRVIINQDMSVSNGEITLPNLSSLESSLYFITVESLDSGASFTNKIIKR